MPGYCVAGTIGHKVLSGAKKIEIDKKMVNVRLSVQYMSFRWANLFNQFLQIKKLSLVLWMLTCYMYGHVLCMCVALSSGHSHTTNVTRRKVGVACVGTIGARYMTLYILFL